MHTLTRVGSQINSLCAKFPVYGPAMHATYGMIPSAMGEGRGEGKQAA
jgi:hypothetical protein